MSLLDTVIGALGQQQPGRGGQADLITAIIGMLGQQGGGGLGGLAGLVDKLQRGGLGDAVNSWVGTGQNQPVAPDQLGGALGEDAVAGFAQQMGLNPQDALGQLSQLLPQVVDRLTPQGQLPAGGTGDISSLAQQAGLGDLEGMLGGTLGRR
jgi:uncharacterized protein YidB (DUF937 family)